MVRGVRGMLAVTAFGRKGHHQYENGPPSFCSGVVVRMQRSFALTTAQDRITLVSSPNPFPVRPSLRAWDRYDLDDRHPISINLRERYRWEHPPGIAGRFGTRPRSRWKGASYRYFRLQGFDRGGSAAWSSSAFPTSRFGASQRVAIVASCGRSTHVRVRERDGWIRPAVFLEERAEHGESIRGGAWSDEGSLGDRPWTRT